MVDSDTHEILEVKLSGTATRQQGTVKSDGMNRSDAHISGMRRFDRSGIPRGFWSAVYNVSLPFGLLLAHVVALFNVKLKAALRGHRRGLDDWQIAHADERRCVLIHVASYGEFEGVIPLIELLNKEGRYRVAVSFSSPSAEKSIKAAEGIWARGYIPVDSFYRQLEFLARLDPAILLISKHDFWPNNLRAAKTLGIPAILINGNFHPGSRRTFPIVRSFNRSFMKHLHAVWTVSEADARRVEPLLSRGTELQAVGDTRYDRVRHRADSGRERFGELKQALLPGPVIVVGSSWQPDEKICWDAFDEIHRLNGDARLVVVPHEPTPEALERNRTLAKRFGYRIRLFTEWNGGKIEEPVLLVDSLGVLADLYTVGWAAFVGGGFGVGVHSVIEPAAHGLPVAFGPNCQVSHEAGLLIEAGGGYIARKADDLKQLWLNWINDERAYLKAADAAALVVTSREGVSEKLMKLLNPFLG